MTGLVNFGQILPFAIGAYAIGVGVQFGVPWWLSVVAGLIVAPAFGLLVILPARRQSQDYWALITLGAASSSASLCSTFLSSLAGPTV